MNLCKYFYYKDGVLYWQPRTEDMFATRKAFRIWNKRFSNKPSGHVDSEGYVKITCNYKTLKAHRIIWELLKGEIPEGFEIDHIDHNRKNNRIENLRLVSIVQNRQNMSKFVTNTSGCNGVHWNKNKNKWEPQITINGKKKYLGRFDNLSDAIEARKNAEIIFGFHKNHGSDRPL